MTMEPNQINDMQADTGADRCCPFCTAPAAEYEPVVKRGAIVVALDPIAVWWRSRPVPLSRTEAGIFALVVRRGRLSFEEIEQALVALGASVKTRPHVLGHIRRKLQDLGACDPFERLAKDMIRLRVDPDENGSREPVIGLKQSRYARAPRDGIMFSTRLR